MRSPPSAATALGRLPHIILQPLSPALGRLRWRPSHRGAVSRGSWGHTQVHQSTGSAAFSELEEGEGRLQLGPPGGCAHVKDEGAESPRGKATGPASHSLQAMPRAVPRAHTVLHQTGAPPLDPPAAQAQALRTPHQGPCPNQPHGPGLSAGAPGQPHGPQGRSRAPALAVTHLNRTTAQELRSPPAPSQRGRALVQKLPTAFWQVWKWGGWGLVFTGLQGRFHPCPSLRP